MRKTAVKPRASSRSRGLNVSSASFRSQRLRASDLRDVFQLVGEITEFGRDPAEWRAHMLRRLLHIVGARLGLAGEHYISPAAPQFVGLVEVGWEPSEQQLF